MATTLRDRAQRRVDEVHIFRNELGRLKDEGVLDLDEAQQSSVDSHHQQLLQHFCEQYDVDHNKQSRQLSLGMRIASFFGALSIAASIFFLFFKYWGFFSELAQVSILIASALGLVMATFYVQGRDSSGYFTKLVALVAFTCFVLNIYMLGQIFNITPSDKALLPWAALALLLAYSCDLRLLLAAGILCIIAFVSARVGTWNGGYWIHFGKHPENFMPVAFFLFFVPQIIDHSRFWAFDVIYRVFGIITLFLPVLVLSNWGDISYLSPNVDSNTIEVFYQLVGFIGSALVIGYGVHRHWPDVVNSGITLFVIFLFTKFFDWWWEWMPKYLFFLVIGLVAVLFLVIFRRLRHSGYLQWGGEL